MKKDELWQIYADRNPAFLADGAKFTAKGLRKFFDQTWDIAHKQGVANGRALADDVKRESGAGSLFDDIFRATL